MVKLYFSSVNSPNLTELSAKKAGALAFVESPTEDDIKRLSQEDGLDEDLIIDGLDQNESPRIEKWDGRVYVYSRYVLDEKEKLTTAPVLLVFGVNMVYVISALPFNDFRRMLDKEKITTSKRSKLLLQILNTINAGYKKRINNIGKRIYGLRSQLDKAHIANKDFIAFIDIEEDLNDILLALEPMNALLNNLLTGKEIRLYEDDQDLMEDLELSSDELIRLADSQLKTLKNIREAYSTMTANNLNKVFKLMTSITILMGIFTLITGIYSMNISLPAAHNPNAFWIILGLTAGLISIAAALFKKKHWF